MRRIDRSVAALVAMTLASSLALGSVAAAQSEAMEPDESITGTVTFWNGYGADGDEITAFRDEVLPAFQAAYPNVTVETQEIPVRRPAPEARDRDRRRRAARCAPRRHHLGPRVR